MVFRTLGALLRKVRDKIAGVSAHLQESIAGVRVVQAFRRERSDCDRRRPPTRRTGRQLGDHRPERRLLLVEFMSAVGIVIVLWYGGVLQSHDALEIGVLVAFVGYLASFFDPIQQLSQLYNTFQASMAAVRKVYTVLDTEPDMTDAPDAQPLSDVRGAVRFEQVSFAYGLGRDATPLVGRRVAARGRGAAWHGQTGAREAGQRPATTCSTTSTSTSRRERPWHSSVRRAPASRRS
jgi:ABC-type multidrug transport system fused ATPase/permease subunit